MLCFPDFSSVMILFDKFRWYFLLVQEAEVPFSLKFAEVVVHKAKASQVCVRLDCGVNAIDSEVLVHKVVKLSA